MRKEIDQGFSLCCCRFSVVGWQRSTCDHFVTLSLHEGAFSFYV